MAKSVLVVLAEGFEEIEAVTPIDVLRRAGLEVTTAGVSQRDVTGAHGIQVKADLVLGEFKGTPDAVVLPGGMPGAKNLSESPELARLLAKMNQEGKLIGAICAAPALVLSKIGLLDGRKATCYPSFEKNFSSKTTFSEARVVRDGHVITSRGPGSALEFALELVKELVGPKEAEKLSGVMLTLNPA